MAQSLARIHLHLVFSTKERRDTIPTERLPDLWDYVGGILRKLECPAHRVGGTTNHIHVACCLARDISPSNLVRDLKSNSSKWLAERIGEPFHWQNGYGAFSVGESQLDALVAYIANQAEHHRRVSFEDEYRAFLRKYNIEFDEKYVWG